MKKRKVYEISVIDKTYSKIISDETKFYTSDTVLELGFELKETEYTFESAEIVLLNIDDRSLVTRPVAKVLDSFAYELEDDITAHYGEWRGQLRFEQAGEIYVSSPVKFRIENDLSNDRPPQLSDVQSWVSLKRYADELVEELKQAVLSVEGIEDTFNANESERQTTFETNESLRNETFNTNETTRQENESARIEAEKQREGTVAEIENRQTSVENQFNAIQQDLTDKDVISAPEIIASRNGEANLKTRLDKEQQEVSMQLAQTLKKGDVSVNDINKNLGLLDETYMSDEFLQQMAGNTPINSVPADESITTEKLANRSVTEDKSRFFKISKKNLLNPNKTKEKTKVETETDGREQVFKDIYGAYRASDFIEVTPNTQYVVNVLVHSVVYFDADKKYIGSYYEPKYLPERILAGNPFTTPANTAYMRFNLRSEIDVSKSQVEKGNVVTEFEPYFIPPTYNAPKSIERSQLKDEIFLPYATKTELSRIEGKVGSGNNKEFIPNNFKRWKLLDDCTDASAWTYDSVNSSATGMVSEVTEIDSTKFPSSVGISEDTLKPWLFSDKGSMSGLGGVLGNKMLKFEVSTNGRAFFHRALPEREDFSEKGEMAFAVWIDSVSTDTDESANIQQTAYHNYPENLTQFHRSSDAYSSMINGKGTWALAIIPSIRKQLNPIIWVQAGSSPYGIKTLKTTDGIGFRVTNTKSDGKVARVYVSGIFRIDNTLDKGKLIITFDDGFQSQYSEAFKYMYNQYGYKGNIAMVGSWVENGEMGQFPELPAMTVSQMLEVQESGWDIVSHTWSHKNLGYDGYSPSYVYNEVQKNYQWLIDNGITNGSRFMMYPEGSWNKVTLEVMKQFHVMARTTSPIYMQINPTLRQYTYPSIDSASLTETAWRNLLQTIQDHKTVVSRHFHHVGTGGWNPITVEKFRLFIDIIQEYDVDVITWSEFYDNYVVAE